MTLTITESLERRFWSKVAAPNDTGCMLWLAARDPLGYGRFSAGTSRAALAHRVAFQIATGDDPTGLVVMHRCDTPSCVAPDHLQLGTHADNIADKVAKGRHAWPAMAGENNPNAKITDAQASDILALLAEGRQIKEVAALYGVKADTISAIKHGHRKATDKRIERAMA